MKKFACFSILGLIGVLAFYVSATRQQPVYARKIAQTTTESPDTCFATVLDMPSDPQVRTHRAGTGIRPEARSTEDYSEALPTLNSQTATARNGVTSRGTAIKHRIWKPADTVTRETGDTIVLKVRFLDGSPEYRKHVRRVAPQWSQYANVRFEFVESGPADIRIGFDPFDPEGTYWSKVGSGANWSKFGSYATTGIPLNHKTMNLGFRGTGNVDRVILHEFGHALGLYHEHQNPAVSIQWDEQAIINEFKGPPNRWSKEKTRFNVINRLNTDETNFTAFDPDSIMLYPIPNRWTIGNFETTYNTKLSSTDKRFIRQLYPKSTPPPPKITLPLAEVRKLWVEHNLNLGYGKGMLIHVKFAIQNFKGKNGSASAYFYFRNDKPLKDFNQRYWTTDGAVGVSKAFRPIYQNAMYEDLSLFIPYSELHLNRNRKHKLKLVVLIASDTKSAPLVTLSNWYYFIVTT